MTHLHWYRIPEPALNASCHEPTAQEKMDVTGSWAGQIEDAAAVVSRFDCLTAAHGFHAALAMAFRPAALSSGAAVWPPLCRRRRAVLPALSRFPPAPGRDAVACRFYGIAEEARRGSGPRSGAAVTAPPPSPPPHNPFRPHLYIALALCLLALLAYSNSFRDGYTLDCNQLLTADTRIQQATAANVDQILHHTYWWPYGESGLYRP